MCFYFLILILNSLTSKCYWMLLKLPAIYSVTTNLCLTPFFLHTLLTFGLFLTYSNIVLNVAESEADFFDWTNQLTLKCNLISYMYCIPCYLYDTGTSSLFVLSILLLNTTCTCSAIGRNTLDWYTISMKHGIFYCSWALSKCSS